MSEKENKTKTFVLRINEDMFKALEKWASDEFRSTNGQLLWIIEQALGKRGYKSKTRDDTEKDNKNAQPEIKS